MRAVEGDEGMRRKASRPLAGARGGAPVPVLRLGIRRFRARQGAAWRQVGFPGGRPAGAPEDTCCRVVELCLQTGPPAVTA